MAHIDSCCLGALEPEPQVQQSKSLTLVRMLVPNRIARLLEEYLESRFPLKAS